jgi:hypothetical protein
MQTKAISSFSRRAIGAYAKSISVEAPPTALAVRIAQGFNMHCIMDTLDFFEYGIGVFNEIGFGLIEVELKYRCGFNNNYALRIPLVNVTFAGLFASAGDDIRSPAFEVYCIDALTPQIQALVEPMLAAIGMSSIELTYPFDDYEWKADAEKD